MHATDAPAQPPHLRACSARTAICLLLMAALLSGCGLFHHRDRQEAVARGTAEVLYGNAHRSLQSNDFENAVRQYEALTARYPFTDQARQARIDLIYAYYRKDDDDAAVDAAKQFILENPTNPRVDYAWYMQGLVKFERIPFRLERWLGVDMARRPPKDIEEAMTAFATVARDYPQSVYAEDARRRLTYLRNRLAEYEVGVARYYIRRGAYDAAARRAQRTVEQYDGAPAVRNALEVMVEAYDRLGFADLKANVERVYQLNYPGAPPAKAKAKHHRWRFW